LTDLSEFKAQTNVPVYPSGRMHCEHGIPGNQGTVLL